MLQDWFLSRLQLLGDCSLLLVLNWHQRNNATLRSWTLRCQVGHCHLANELSWTSIDKVHEQQTVDWDDTYSVSDCSTLSIWKTKDVKVLSLASSHNLGASLKP